MAIVGVKINFAMQFVLMRRTYATIQKRMKQFNEELAQGKRNEVEIVLTLKLKSLRNFHMNTMTSRVT